MRKTMLAALAAFALMTSAAFAADAPALADRHAKLGVKCEQCHGTKAPAAEAKVKNEACFACHQNYDALNLCLETLLNSMSGLFFFSSQKTQCRLSAKKAGTAKTTNH